jgi:hypothetical protein
MILKMNITVAIEMNLTQMPVLVEKRKHHQEFNVDEIAR